ncbi:hypothetical protein SDJN03_05474, partial [Cucurbita argyrosperma subsp. sororia]
MAITIDQEYEKLFMMAAFTPGGGEAVGSEDGGCTWPSCPLATQTSSSTASTKLRTAEGRAAIVKKKKKKDGEGEDFDGLMNLCE